MSVRPLRPGDRVEYVGEPVFDLIITTGEIGTVTRVADGWVYAEWPRAGIHSVPTASVVLASRSMPFMVPEEPNARLWPFIGEELPPLSTGRERDPYINQGCHPDIVERLWKDLGTTLPRNCRAQAKGRPVLAHPEALRIFAVARGTAYALWLVPGDFEAAVRNGASTRMTWSGGRVTDLASEAGPGWIWGKWYSDEPRWLLHSFQALSSGPQPA